RHPASPGGAEDLLLALRLAQDDEPQAVPICARHEPQHMRDVVYRAGVIATRTRFLHEKGHTEAMNVTPAGAVAAQVLEVGGRPRVLARWDHERVVFPMPLLRGADVAVAAGRVSSGSHESLRCGRG